MKSSFTIRRLRLILKCFFQSVHNLSEKAKARKKNNQSLSLIFFSTKHVEIMLKSKTTQKTVAFSSFPQKSIMIVNYFQAHHMKLETMYYPKTFSAECKMLSRFPLYIYIEDLIFLQNCKYYEVLVNWSQRIEF